MEKRVKDSRAETVYMIMPRHLNSGGRLFGGQLLEWIDALAGAVARRHSECEVTTAAVDNLRFIAPALPGDTVVLTGKLTYVGRRSMEVRVDTFTEALRGERTLINTAYLVMVAIDGEGKSIPVPALVPETEEEKREWQSGRLRSEQRKKSRDCR